MGYHGEKKMRVAESMHLYEPRTSLAAISATMTQRYGEDVMAIAKDRELKRKKEKLGRTLGHPAVIG